MKRLVTWIAILAGSVVLLAGAGVGWVLATWNRDYSAMPRPAVTASPDPAVVGRGEYVFNAVAHCSICHGGPKAIARRRGDRLPQVGGYVFHAGPFGTFVARNLTADRETGLGAQSDGDLARVLRSAVDRDGRFIPFMKIGVGPMADEDITALVSYLRTLPAVRRPEEPETWGFLAKTLAATRFRPEARLAPPYVPQADAPSVARGNYLANGPAACRYCHTRHDPMAGFVEVAPPFTGGDVEPDEADPASEFAAPNLTPHAGSSPLGAWDEATFVTRFRGGLVLPGSHMPWENFAEMTDSDVRSLYRYLRSLPAVATSAGPSHRPAGWKPAG
jgi:mono/diheme cytochrome c family protein